MVILTAKREAKICILFDQAITKLWGISTIDWSVIIKNSIKALNLFFSNKYVKKVKSKSIYRTTWYIIKNLNNIPERSLFHLKSSRLTGPLEHH